MCKVIQDLKSNPDKSKKENNISYTGLNINTIFINHSMFLPSPLNLQTVQAPLFKQFPYILFFCTLLPLKTWIFLWTPKRLKFFVLHAILSFKSKWILSYDRAKTLFIIFFLSLHIADFGLKLHPPPPLHWKR